MNPLQFPKDDDAVIVNGINFTYKDISNVIDDFYRQVAVDPLLSVPFGSVEDWPHHIQRLTHFWWTRLGGRAYLELSYDPIGKHFASGFNEEFLTRWLTLFRQVTDKILTPPQAALWSVITQRMGEALTRNNEFMKQKYS